MRIGKEIFRRIRGTMGRGPGLADAETLAGKRKVGFVVDEVVQGGLGGAGEDPPASTPPQVSVQRMAVNTFGRNYNKLISQIGSTPGISRSRAQCRNKAAGFAVSLVWTYVRFFFYATFLMCGVLPRACANFSRVNSLKRASENKYFFHQRPYSQSLAG